MKNVKMQPGFTEAQTMLFAALLCVLGMWGYYMAYEDVYRTAYVQEVSINVAR